jgi:hypothetical protein
MDIKRQKVGYILTASANTTSPADATTYYFGFIPVLALTTSNAVQRVYPPKAGTIRAVRIIFNQVVGSAETSSMWLRINDTTDYLISSAVTNDSVVTTFLKQGLSIPLTTSDYFEIKWTTPTWVTNPTSLRPVAYVYID